ncbi:transposase [Streptomyces sp. NPDC059525]|uniref:IS110 family transposase n=1 Tax=Streptomyces sp. NPDC059525 TaxID=3346857 RepID=UPI0036C13DD7
MIDTGDIDVYLGLDVGKGEHHATAVTPAGKKAFDKRLPNTDPKLRELLAKLQVKHGTVLVVVDQPASIGALPLAGEPQRDAAVFLAVGGVLHALHRSGHAFGDGIGIGHVHAVEPEGAVDQRFGIWLMVE